VTNPTYKHVCSGVTDHAEAVRIEFDPSKVAYEQLVGKSVSSHKLFIANQPIASEFFYRIHDPTMLNRQGNEIGSREYHFLYPLCNTYIFRDFHLVFRVSFCDLYSFR